MTRVKHELTDVFSTRKKFRDVTAMFETNKDLNAIGGVVYEWLFRMWSRDIVIAVRRELDNDTNTVCLGRLLDEMSQRAQVITRRRFLRDIPESDFMFHILSETFTKHGVVKAGALADPMDDYLDPAGIAEDRKRMAKIAKPVIAYANQLVAHRSETEQIKVTLGDVNRSVDEIEKVFLSTTRLSLAPP